MRAENPVFFLDYDGTLAPIAPRPEEAFPHPEAPRVLEALRARFPVYVITGRRIRDLEALLPLPGLPVVGGTGRRRAPWEGRFAPCFPPTSPPCGPAFPPARECGLRTRASPWPSTTGKPKTKRPQRPAFGVGLGR